MIFSTERFVTWLRGHSASLPNRAQVQAEGAVTMHDAVESFSDALCAKALEVASARHSARKAAIEPSRNGDQDAEDDAEILPNHVVVTEVDTLEAVHLLGLGSLLQIPRPCPRAGPYYNGGAPDHGNCGDGGGADARGTGLQQQTGAGAGVSVSDMEDTHDDEQVHIHTAFLIDGVGD